MHNYKNNFCAFSPPVSAKGGGSMSGVLFLDDPVCEGAEPVRFPDPAEEERRGFRVLSAASGAVSFV